MTALNATELTHTHSGRSSAEVIDSFQGQRANQLLNEAKQALDKAFPLKQGSHCDVVSYFVYYQNLLAFFADGTQTGLQKPCHLIDKEGHREQPESLTLRNEQGEMAQISFKVSGSCGRSDSAHIDEISFRLV
ncbi:Malate synthase [Saliniradius amylolyticus]|uniref:Malate synthase n=1 Tax=Saliniradius amylolyticus TaxID=2183582 RepID=A0A2S2E114_9ALTE|nr:hypothetical protein [Saliniradius amylolyticus]AWL11345.1 Malate synthase [Saliniradius amylolyticus]